MKYGKWIWMWIAWGRVLPGIGWGQPEGTEENPWLFDPAPGELQAAVDQITQVVKKDSRYAQATLGEPIPIYRGIGLWNPKALKIPFLRRGCLLPMRIGGTVIGLVTTDGMRLILRQPFRIWKEEALQQARALAAAKQAEVKRAYLVQLLFMKGEVRGPDGRFGTETKEPLLWDLPLSQGGQWIGAVRIDPYSGQCRVEEFPVPCPVGKTLREEEVKKAAWGYFKQLELAARYPDAHLEELKPSRATPPERYWANIRSKVSLNKPGEGEGSQAKLRISAYGELVMYWLQDPYYGEPEGERGVISTSFEGAEDFPPSAGSLLSGPQPIAESPTVPREQAWKWLGLLGLGLGALGLMVWRRRKR